MADVTLKKIDDMEAVFGGGFKRARAELGVQSFGMQVLDFPPNADQYPEHDHTHDAQEEVFVALRGGGEIELDGELVTIDPETFVRVGPETKRKLWPGDEGLRVLIISGVPGGVYEPSEVTMLGAPDPMATN